MKRKPNHISRLWVLAFGLLFGASHANGQGATRPLHLADALQQAQSHNAQLAAQTAQIDIAKASLDETNAFICPK
jgi:hypothetical protein